MSKTKEFSDYLEFENFVEERKKEKELVEIPELLTAEEIKKAGKLIGVCHEIEESYYYYEGESFAAVLSDTYLDEEETVDEFLVPAEKAKELLEWKEERDQRLTERISEKAKLIRIPEGKWSKSVEDFSSDKVISTMMVIKPRYGKIPFGRRTTPFFNFSMPRKKTLRKRISGFLKKILRKVIRWRH